MYIYERMTSTSLLLAKKFFVGLLLLHYIEDFSSFCCYLTDVIRIILFSTGYKDHIMLNEKWRCYSIYKIIHQSALADYRNKRKMHCKAGDRLLLKRKHELGLGKSSQLVLFYSSSS